MSRGISASKTALAAGGAVLAISALGIFAEDHTSILPSPAKAAVSVPAAPANGNVGFVVSSIDWATGPDADKISCPTGMTTLPEPYVTGNGGLTPGSPEALHRAARQKERSNACSFPEQAGPDPLHRTVVGQVGNVKGLNLDGQDSTSSDNSKAGTCGHENFRGVDGQTGIDNQFFRAVGCATGWQSTGGKRLFGQEMLTGAWGILISLKGVDSLVNDNDVRVGIYANGDPIQLSAARNPLDFATYNPDQDKRFRAETRGRIVNGVLTTDPVNVRFHSVTNTMRLERPMDAARLRMKIMPDGSLDGVMAGYAKIDEFYDFVVGYRNGKDEKGNLSARRNSADGSAGSAGVSCNGLYHAMKALADGERDSKTGKCNAISHAYRIKAIPAFVVEKPTQVASTARNHR